MAWSSRLLARLQQPLLLPQELIVPGANLGEGQFVLGAKEALLSLRGGCRG